MKIETRPVGRYILVTVSSKAGRVSRAVMTIEAVGEATSDLVASLTAAKA